MKHHSLLLIMALLCSMSLSLHAQQQQKKIFINEVMASNSSTVADATGEYEDWLELYNPNPRIASLNGYYITNDISQPTLFRFTSKQSVKAKGFLLLWATGDTTLGANYLPFKLSSSGSGVFLFKPDGVTLVDSITFGKQKSDISYGRVTNGSAVLRFFSAPTPSKSNNTSKGYLGVLEPPSFSVKAGYYATPFALSLSSANTDASIVYTTNGSAPNENNVKGTVYRYKNQYPRNAGDKPFPFLTDTIRSYQYTTPLQIQDASANANRLSLKSSTFDKVPDYIPSTRINKGTVVRAVAVKPDYIPSDIATATYFVTPGGVNKYTLPVISLSIQENYLYNWDSGVYNAGTDFDSWRLANPKANANPGVPANYRREDAEFPLSMEFFENGATRRGFQIDGGFRIHGAWSRAKPQKSLRLYFRSEYGESDLDYKIFPDLPYKDYKRLILRNSGSEEASTRFRDMGIQATVKHLNFSTQDGRPSITFVNGEFWGLLNIRQRYDKYYFEQHFGIAETELDYMENNAVADEGDNKDYISLRNFISNNNMTVQKNYDSVTHRIDMENYIDYHVCEIFYGCTDWPNNNIGYFRKRVPYTPGAPYGLDGRYRWVMFDTDSGLGFGLEDYTGNTLRWATGTRTDVGNQGPPDWATVILRQLTTNAEFRKQFVTRYSDLMNTSLLPKPVISVLTMFHDTLEPHMPEHIERWHHPASMAGWNQSVNDMDTFAARRAPYARQHLRDYFTLSAEKEITLSVSDTSAGFIRINTVDLTPSFPGVPQNAYPWKGLYYSEIPVTLVAKPKAGYRFVRWQGGSAATTDTIVVTLTAATSFTAVFDKINKDTAAIVHYWHFNTLPAGTLTSVAADSTLPGGAAISYEGTGAGYMDATSDGEGTTLNAQYGQAAGFGLRPRNPANTRYLLIKAPTTGYKNIKVSYVATRTSKGAEYQRVSYTKDGATWIVSADSLLIATPETQYGLQNFDFSSIAGVENNPKFALKVEFFGSNAGGTSGNNRFDNILVSGIKAASAAMPPPVVRLSGSATGKGTVLSWSVTNSNAIKAFTVERSFNGQEYAKLHSLTVSTAMPAKGYAYTDLASSSLNHAIVYYRMKAVDESGAVVYSNEVSVSSASAKTVAVPKIAPAEKTDQAALKIMPNPASATATVLYTGAKDETVRMVMESAGGQVVKSWKLAAIKGLNIYAVNVSGFAKGVYIIKVYTGAGIVKLMFLKE